MKLTQNKSYCKQQSIGTFPPHKDTNDPDHHPVTVYGRPGPVCVLSISVIFVLITLAASVPLPQKLIVNEANPATGYWQTKTQWKAYWVKSWVPKWIYVPVWKKIWGPISIKQWVPLPHPPPGLKQ